MPCQFREVLMLAINKITRQYKRQNTGKNCGKTYYLILKAHCSKQNKTPSDETSNKQNQLSLSIHKKYAACS